MHMHPGLRPELEALPPRLQTLPLDARGYPVPWFVQWIDGAPDFRVMDRQKWKLAITTRRCWVCGGALGRHLAFVIGPMCAVTRTTSEPPNHRDCAEWAARNCPFLARPHMVRRESGLPTNHQPAPGLHVDRNPGAVCVWVTTSYTVFRAHLGGGGELLSVGDPTAVVWYAAGRLADRVEVDLSIESGLPALDAVCDKDADPAESRRELQRAVARLTPWLPELPEP